MRDSRRIHITLLLTVLMLSSITMVWLFWRCPLPTCIGTIVILCSLFRCALSARSPALDVAAPD